MAQSTTKKNLPFILGILILCVGMQIANYGSAVCVSGEMTAMNAEAFYVLVSSIGTLGMVLVLPVIGKLTDILGLRTTITIGIVIQFAGRLIMMASGNWISYAAGNLIQAIGGGFYVSAPFVCMASAVDASERAKYFGFIPVANAIGAICGPLAVSAMYASGGILAKLAYILNLPFTLLGLALIFRQCANRKVPGAAKGFDFPGLFLTVLGLSCLVFVLNLGGKTFAWVSLPAIALFIIGIGCLAVMFRRETTIANPVVPIKMFRNKRLLTAFLCAVVAAAYATCSSSYSIMWVRLNYSAFPGAAFYAGAANLPQQVVIVILGMFLGGYIGAKFVKRFRIFGIASMMAAILATGMLYCLKYTGTAADGNILTIGSVPVGMLLIWAAVAVGGFTSVVSQSTFSAFWQTNTKPEDIPSGQAMYAFGSTGGSVIFSAVCGVVLGSSGDYTRAFATGLVFAVFGLIVAFVGFRFSKEEMSA